MLRPRIHVATSSAALLIASTARHGSPRRGLHRVRAMSIASPHGYAGTQHFVETYSTEYNNTLLLAKLSPGWPTGQDTGDNRWLWPSVDVGSTECGTRIPSSCRHGRIWARTRRGSSPSKFLAAPDDANAEVSHAATPEPNLQPHSGPGQTESSETSFDSALQALSRAAVAVLALECRHWWLPSALDP